MNGGSLGYKVVLVMVLIVIQNAKLRKQLSELHQRYQHAKQSMKAATERLNDNSRKKEELMRQRLGNRDAAITAQSK